MRALWASIGRPGQKVPGMVATPYTMDDLKSGARRGQRRRGLPTPSSPRSFRVATSWTTHRCSRGPGWCCASAAPGARSRWRHVQRFRAAARVAGACRRSAALYKAGVDRDDLIVSIDGVNVTSQDALAQVLRKHKPGDQVPVRFVRRSGETVNATLTLEEDPRLEIVPSSRPAAR